MARRGHGEGSVYKRADGRWAGTVDLGWVDGKRRRKTVYGQTQRDVPATLRKVERHVEAFLERWLAQLTVRPSTAESYADIVRLYLVPALGRKRLARLSPSDVQTMLDDLEAPGALASDPPLRPCCAPQGAPPCAAVGRGHAECRRLVDGPRGRSREGRSLTPEQARALLVAAQGDRLGAFVAVAVSCGLRRGEALGLAWDDVDLDDGSLVVRQALQRVGGRLVLDEPKTRGSRRRVELPGAVVVALRAHRSRQREVRLAAGEAWCESGLCSPRRSARRSIPTTSGAI